MSPTADIKDSVTIPPQISAVGTTSECLCCTSGLMLPDKLHTQEKQITLQSVQTTSKSPNQKPGISRDHICIKISAVMAILKCGFQDETIMTYSIDHSLSYFIQHFQMWSIKKLSSIKDIANIFGSGLCTIKINNIDEEDNP